MKKTALPFGIYGITADEFSKGRSCSFVVKEMLAAGVKIIQYREKENKSIREKWKDCLEIRKMTRDAGALFFVNDSIDLAMLVDADGVHIGQDDLPVAEVRKLIGNKIIGLSTHSPEQAKAAINDGADYIGVGPIYRTFTKKDVGEPLGFDYLDYVSKEVELPFVAIGGIKESNLDEVIRHGAKTIALVTEIVSADDIKATAAKLVNRMREAGLS